MILTNVLTQYKKNMKAAIAFALLLVFVPVFAIFENVFVSNGSIFLEYTQVELTAIPFFAIPWLVFLLFYSLLMVVIIFSVKKDLSKLKLNFYLREMIQKFALKIFVFFVVFSLALYFFVFLMFLLGVELIWISLAMLVISLLLMFVPQSIVVDEEDVPHAILNNFEFILKNPRGFLQVLVIGAVLLAVTTLVSEIVDMFYFVGSYVSLLLSFILVLPFIEVMKTYLYMLKFDLIKSYLLAGQTKRKRVPEPNPVELGPSEQQ